MTTLETREATRLLAASKLRGRLPWPRAAREGSARRGVAASLASGACPIGWSARCFVWVEGCWLITGGVWVLDGAAKL